MGVLLTVLLVIGVTVLVPAIIAFGISGGFTFSERRRVTEKRKAPGRVCRLDVDCPGGYICEDGVCVPARA